MGRGIREKYARLSLVEKIAASIAAKNTLKYFKAEDAEQFLDYFSKLASILGININSKVRPTVNDLMWLSAQRRKLGVIKKDG